ncbi:undecaprenyl-diphosphatase [Brevibacillus ginsengisoli]|uniref:undecaprenyl-diphosphatase n=1 Tax=Brevibacillus ginsengisoli TaxID=363854 RepID=UPI003CE8019B
MDWTLFQMINHLSGHSVFLDHFMIMYTKYGPLLFGVILLCLWFARSNNQMKNRQTVLLSVAATGVALGINQIISMMYFRPRPFTSHVVNLLIDKSIDPSFPSDHSAGAFALALSISLANRKLGYGMVILALLLAISRVYVGVHYPFDVIGGAFTGLMGTLLVKWLKPRLMPIINWFLDTFQKAENTFLHKEV